MSCITNIAGALISAQQISAGAAVFARITVDLALVDFRLAAISFETGAAYTLPGWLG